MAILGAYMLPHPPIIIPEVGKGREKEAAATIEAFKSAVKEIVELKPDTIVIISPHIEMYSDYFHIVPGDTADGNMKDYGAPDVKFCVRYDTELRERLCILCEEYNVRAGTLGQRTKALDSGSMVPLYFLCMEYGETLPPVIRIGVSGQMLHEHYRLGMIISQAADALKRKIVVIASGDLSHRLSAEGAYGYVKEGPEYDKRLMTAMEKGDFEELFSFDEAFLDKAGECGHRGLAVMAGALDCIKVVPEKLSYEGPFGVGYGVCAFIPACVQPDFAGRNFYDIYTEKIKNEMQAVRDNEDEYVALARKALEAFVLRQEITKVPKDASSKLREQRAGVFVCIKKQGRLRGCIGTVEPVMGNVGEEIIMNAMSVAVRDNRFEPVSSDELEMLTYNVDVLTESEPVESADELNVKKYGLIVESGERRGVLLPNLDSVNSVEEQISIAKNKAGIKDGEEFKMRRFEITRHF